MVLIYNDFILVLGYTLYKNNMIESRGVNMAALKEAFLIKVPKVDSKDAKQEIVLPHYEFYTILVEDMKWHL